MELFFSRRMFSKFIRYGQDTLVSEIPPNCSRRNFIRVDLPDQLPSREFARIHLLRTTSATSSLLSPQLIQRGVQSRLAKRFPHRGHRHCVSHHAPARYAAIQPTMTPMLTISFSFNLAIRNPIGTSPMNSTTTRFRRAT